MQRTMPAVHQDLPGWTHASVIAAEGIEIFGSAESVEVQTMLPESETYLLPQDKEKAPEL